MGNQLSGGDKENTARPSGSLGHRSSFSHLLLITLCLSYANLKILHPWGSFYKLRCVHTSTSKSYEERSSPMWCAFFWGPLLATGLPPPWGQIKRADWDTRPGKVTSYAGFLCAMVDTNAWFLEAQLRAGLSIMVLISHKVCLKPSGSCWETSKMPLWGSESSEFLWVDEDSAYKFVEVILIDPLHKTRRRNPDSPPSINTGRCVSWHMQVTEIVALESSEPHYWWSCCVAWRRRNTLQLHCFH